MNTATQPQGNPPPTVDTMIEGCLQRVARKVHTCWSCGQPIPKGSTYIEYLGDSTAYQSGKRYDLGCAVAKLTERAVQG
jgi:hypothetical protein